MKFSEGSLQIITGWTIQEIAQMVRHPEWYSELKYTKGTLQQLCRELGIDYNGVIESFKDEPSNEVIEDGREYVYADGWYED